MARRVEGKVALVTGAASGLGLATAQLLAQEGATIVVSDVDDAKGKRAVAEIEESGARALYMHLDVCEEGEWRSVVDAIKAAFGRIDILVNNAGMCPYGLVTEISLDTWRKTTAVNYDDGTFLGCKTCLPLMRAGGGGAIVNIASTAGVRPVEFVLAYSAVKAAVLSFTQGLAAQCGSAQDGVRVNAVLPGIMDTPMQRSDMTIDQRAQRVVPMKRAGKPSDVAQGVLYLVSDEARYVTGMHLVIDGGLTLRFPLVPPADYYPDPNYLYAH